MSTSKNKLLLKSCDGEIFEVDEVVASKSLTIKHAIEFFKDVAGKVGDSPMPVPNGKSADSAITLQKVTGKTLAKVIEYCKKHVLASDSVDPLLCAVDDELKAFDVEFVSVDKNTLVDLISGLLDLTCKAVADKLNGKTPEEMRAEFNIVNDHTPEEEEQIRKEIEWAFGSADAPSYANDFFLL